MKADIVYCQICKNQLLFFFPGHKIINKFCFIFIIVHGSIWLGPEIQPNLLVLDLVSQVRDVVLMSLYLDLGNPGGSGFWDEGYMSKGREMES